MSLHNTLTGIALAFACTTLVACKSGYNRLYEDNSPEDEDSPACSASPINESIADNTMKVFDLIANITCTRITDYTLVGQSLGHGNELQDTSNTFRSYKALVEDIFVSEKKRIAVISIDYEKSQQFDLTALKDANLALQKHTEAGGIVSVTWTPLNPWTVNNSETTDKLTQIDKTEITALYADKATLAGDNLAAYNTFNDQLTIIVDALKDLDSKKIPVLFAPFPQMNTTDYWYGPSKDKAEGDDTETPITTEAEFIALWSHVADKLKAENLTHLLWVYAPRTGVESVRKSATWGYPGKGDVDIVSSISYSDEASISDYPKYVALNKPLGMTKLAPKTADGQFSNDLYIIELQAKYKNIAYWIADHDTQGNDGGTKLSIKSNENTTALFENKSTATVETIKAKKWLDVE